MKDVAQFVVFGGAFLVLFIPLLVSDSMFFPFITGKNFWFRIIVEIMFGAWVLLALYEPAYRPKFSWFLPSIGLLLVIMFFANLFGEFPLKSFWSNYERMDGYVTLVHFAMYFVILGSIFSQREIDVMGFKTTVWQIFSVTAIVAAILVAGSAFKQLAGVTETTMGARINGTLGNAAYMAVYMLFNTFLVTWVWLHTKQRWLQVTCGFLVALFAFLLIQTATRGTILGLAGGVVMGSIYIAIFNTQYKVVRKIALGIIMAVVVVVAGLTTFKNTDYVQDSMVLRRATAINLEELNLRMTIWDMAIDGVVERPVLGWGQGNFNYVFNEFYDPSIAGRSELWYDRAHNVFVDWAVTGGVLGLTAYLSIFGVGLLYLFFTPLLYKDERFTVAERGLLIAIGSGYFIHNLVVFDNIVSYIFFAVFLAIVHSRVAEPISQIAHRTYSPAVITQIAAPIIIIATAASIYFVNVPSMNAAQDIIASFRAQTVDTKVAAFDQAFARGGFGTQEITEQMVQQALTFANNPNTSTEDKNRFIVEAEQRLLRLVAEKSTDARVHVFAMSFYRGIGQLDKAREHYTKARALSPGKVAIIHEAGLIEYQAKNIPGMLMFMQEAYDLNPANKDAQTYLVISHILNGADPDEVITYVTDSNWPVFARNNFALRVIEQAEAWSIMVRMLEDRIQRNPTDTNSWISLAFVQYRENDVSNAIRILQEATVANPAIANATTCFIENLEAGREPNEGC